MLADIPKPKPRTVLPSKPILTYQTSIESAMSSNQSTLNRSDTNSVKYSDEDDFDAKDIQEFVSKELHKSNLQKMCSLPKFQANYSSNSLRSLESLPPFLEEHEDPQLKKWNNLDGLDDVSMISEDTNSIAWVIGENCSDSGMFTNIFTSYSKLKLKPQYPEPAKKQHTF